MRDPVSSKNDVFERLKSVGQQLPAMGVSHLGLFGSFISGNPTPQSDVDILVEFLPEQHTFDRFMELSFFLEDLLGRRVELVTPEGLSPYIGPEILRQVERVQIAA